MKKILTSLLIILMISGISLAQEKEKKDIFSVNADLVSSYVWRGSQLSRSPNIQPYVCYAPKFGLEAGAWGSFNMNGDYGECDLFLTYRIKGFYVTLNDYFVFDPGASGTNYFDCNNKTTAHLAEACIGYDGPDKFPVSILAGTMFYGADKKLSSMTIDTVLNDTVSTYQNRYSTYFEVGWTVRNVKLFVGVTPFESMYGKKAGIVNAGFTASRNIKLTEKFSLPVKATLLTNPDAKKIFFVFGITL